MKGSALQAPAIEALADKALGKTADAATKALYGRYLRALALLCECAPYVDDPDYVELIDEVLDDACRHYPLKWTERDGHRELAPKGARAPSTPK